MAKNLMPDFGLFWPKFAPSKFFSGFYLYNVGYTLLQAMIFCNFKEN